MIDITIPPCKDCENRHLGCHSTCKNYQEWSQLRKYHNAQIRLDKSLRHSSSIIIERNKKRRKKR